MHYIDANLGENGVKMGNPLLDFDPNELVLSFQAPRVCAKFCQNGIKIATERGWTDTQTEMTQVIL